MLPVQLFKTSPLHLRFLDGLRGLAALYVLLFHLRLCTNFDDLPRWARYLQPPVAYGHFAVCIFIVLSGYCLMLPVVRGLDGKLRGGVGGFVRRRAHRILPPYYASFVLSMAWILFYEGSKRWTGHVNCFSLEFSAGNILSHLLLVFNLFPAFWGATNGALWSVASEWQIYFVFALILLPIWRRFGIVAMFALSMILGIGPHYCLSPGMLQSSLDHACSWFVMLFALGMVGAFLQFSSQSICRTARPLPWGMLSITLTMVVAVVTATYHPVDNPWDGTVIRHYTWSTDLLAGTATLCLIMFCTATMPTDDVERTNIGSLRLAKRSHSMMLAFLEDRRLVALGGFSYSLYLVHAPIVSACLYAAVHSGLSPTLRLFSLWTVGILASLTSAFVFSLYFERPFLSRAARRAALVEFPAGTNVAPTLANTADTRTRVPDDHRVVF